MEREKKTTMWSSCVKLKCTPILKATVASVSASGYLELGREAETIFSGWGATVLSSLLLSRLWKGKDY